MDVALEDLDMRELIEDAKYSLACGQRTSENIRRQIRAALLEEIDRLNQVSARYRR